jgi:hypothetical protein
MKSSVLAAIALAALLGGGCANQRPPGERENMNLLTHEQIMGAGVQDLHQAVSRLRPQWLTQRGAVSVNDPTPPTATVFVDGAQAGSLSQLQRIELSNVGQVRYWTPGEAASRFGMGHHRGVIEITTRAYMPY